MYKIVMICFDVDPSIKPYKDCVEQQFGSKEEAQRATVICVL